LILFNIVKTEGYRPELNFYPILLTLILSVIVFDQTDKNVFLKQKNLNL